MIEFSKYFNDEYQFTLKEVAYSRIEDGAARAGLKLNIEDSLTTEIKENRLDVTFCRDVCFTPEALYKAKVTLGFTLTFRSNVTDDVAAINWSEGLVNGDNPYLSNIVSRASFLIATLTSSYGQQPLVTPPSFIKQNNLQ